jgi:hypothetical protein
LKNDETKGLAGVHCVRIRIDAIDPSFHSDWPIFCPSSIIFHILTNPYYVLKIGGAYGRLSMKIRSIVFLLLPMAIVFCGSSTCNRSCELQQAVVMLEVLDADLQTSITLRSAGVDSLYIVEENQSLNSFLDSEYPQLPLAMEKGSSTFVFKRDSVWDTLRFVYQSSVVEREFCNGMGFVIEDFILERNTFPNSSIDLYPENGDPSGDENNNEWLMAYFSVVI